MKIIVRIAVLAVVLLTVDCYIGEILDYCNEDSSKGEIIQCAAGLTCDSDYHQCLVPVGGTCTTTYVCSVVCYNSTCYSSMDAVPNQCNTTVACTSPLTCDSVTDLCKLPSGSACSAQSLCSEYSACNDDGICGAPELFDQCDPTGALKCKNGLYCDPFWKTCLIGSGSPCNKTIQCGGEYTRLCSQGVCRNPGINERCNIDNEVLPVTTCSEGVCDGYSGFCISKAFQISGSVTMAVCLALITTITYFFNF